MGDFFNSRTQNVNTQTGGQRQLSGQLQQQLSALLTPGSQASNQQFQRGILNPALQNFDQSIRPRISSGFAQHGATLSSRRGDAMSQALSNLFTGAQQQQTQLQLGALGQSNQFAGGDFSRVLSSPGIGTQLLQAGATVGGAILGGGK